MAISAASPDRINATSKAQEAAETGPPPWGIPVELSAAVRSANLAMKSGQRRQLRDHQRASDEGKREHPHGDRDREAGLVLMLTTTTIIVFSIRLPGDGEHAGSRFATSLHEFDQEEKRADAKRRADNVEENSRGEAGLSDPDRREQRSGG